MSSLATDHWNTWLDSAPGRYMLAWEQQEHDRLVDDVFGFYAVQCGLPQLDCLRASRMSSRIHARTQADLDDALVPADAHQNGVTTVRVGHFGELPFGSQTLDLIVLPHVLEFAIDPHEVLREVDRVLRQIGRAHV